MLNCYISFIQPRLSAMCKDRIMLSKVSDLQQRIDSSIPDRASKSRLKYYLGGL